MVRLGSATFPGIFVVLLLSAAGAQDSQDPDTASGAEDDRAGSPDVDRCFSARSIIDMTAFDDQHIYVRTRGSNHYLLTTNLCRNLERSTRSDDARLVPYGQTVCHGDGSYIVYERVGREMPCAIESIQRVPDRQAARAIAEGRRADDDLTEIPLPD